MKVILSIFCWVLAAFSIYFPFAYFHKDMDKQEIKISHILVNTREEALKIKEKIGSGKSFEEMAEKYSLCPSKEQKGDIGYNMRGKLIPEFENAAFTLPLKMVSEPVQTREGWHLIKVYEAKYFSDKENFERRYF